MRFLGGCPRIEGVRGTMRAKIVGLSLVLGAWSGGATLGPVRAEGYAGVVPGGQGTVAPSTRERTRKASITWPGFQVLPDGSTRIFVQTDRPVTPELRRVDSGFAVMMRGAVLPKKGNVRRPLDTHYFNTPVRSVRFTAGREGVTLWLDMRAQGEPRLRTEQTAAGFFSYMEFAAGNYL